MDISNKQKITIFQTSVIWTHLCTDPTSNTEWLGNIGYFVCRDHLNAQFPCWSKNFRLHHQAVSSKVTEILPILTTGQDFLHSCLHFLGLHRSAFTMAILVSLSCSAIAPSSLYWLWCGLVHVDGHMKIFISHANFEKVTATPPPPLASLLLFQDNVMVLHPNW